jgi:hypothetical protein
VGLGKPEEARAFRERSGWPGTVLVDAKGEAYRALAFGRTTLFGALRPAVLKAALRARKAGHRQGKTQGDPWQLGGTVVVAPGDRLLLVHRDRGVEDEASVDALLEALRRA